MHKLRVYEEQTAGVRSESFSGSNSAYLKVLYSTRKNISILRHAHEMKVYDNMHYIRDGLFALKIVKG